MTKRGFSRRKFLACASVIGLGLSGDAALVEPFRLTVGRHEFKSRVPVPDRPIKLLHLSDLHASWCVSLDYIEKAINLGLQLQPDLICVTGDFITSRYRDFESYAKILAKLSQAAPTFASLGNHDGGIWASYRNGYPTPAEVCRLLEQSRIQLLHNQTAPLRLKERDLQLTGLADVWSEGLNMRAAFPPGAVPPGTVRIVLSHNPDTKEFLRVYPWDLLLSGHTHGGQVVLPLIGSPWAPVRDKKFMAGMYAWENRSIHITPGIGNVRGVRFNCPPEVSLITVV